MFISLPSSLLSLVLCVLESQAASLTANEPTSQGNIAGYVATGLGASRDPTTTAPRSTITQVPTTGSGSAYASRCNAALIAWSSSSFDWQWAHAKNVTKTVSNEIVFTSHAPGSTSIKSVITLCDGYSRVVGQTSVSYGAESVGSDAYTNTYTQTIPNHAYPAPAPCSIKPNDCRSLSNSFNALVSKLGSYTGAAPQCSVHHPTPSYSRNSWNQTCDNCMIVASTARLMYWPITTAEGVGNLCSGASTITPSPIDTAPNSFVTQGITITSPNVAISFGYMSRADDCGPTLAHTIIPVKPEEVTSVRGFRALFSHHQFNFADLNWHCMSTNSTNYTLDATVDDNSCYQAVPAEAYWGGLNNAVVQDQYVFRTMSKWQSTIYNNYQPQILPPQTMTSAIASLWGNGCIIHPDGVWDPPIALTPEATLDLPGHGPGESRREPTTTISASPGFPFAPSPAVMTSAVSLDAPSYTTHDQHFTALPENESIGNENGQGGSGAQPTAGADAGVSGAPDGPGQQNGSGSDQADDGSGAPGSANPINDGDSGSSGSSDDAGSSANGGSSSSGADSGISGVSDGPGQQSGSSSDQAEDGSGAAGSAGQVNDGDSGKSGGSGDGDNSGDVISSGGGVSSSNDGNSSEDESSSKGASSSNDGNSSNGGSSTNDPIDGTDGLPSGGTATGNSSPDSSSDASGGERVPVITIGSSTFSIVASATNMQVLAHGGSTFTIGNAGPAATIDGQVVRLVPSGRLIVGYGAQATTFQAAASRSTPTTVIVVNAKTITASRMANGAWVLPDSSTTRTASIGGDEVTIDAVAAGSVSLSKNKATVDTAAKFSAVSTGLVRVDGSQRDEGSVSSNDGTAASASTDAGKNADSTRGAGSGSGSRSTGTYGSQATSAGSSAKASQSSDASGRSYVLGSTLGLALGIAGLIAL